MDTFVLGLAMCRVEGVTQKGGWLIFKKEKVKFNYKG